MTQPFEPFDEYLRRIKRGMSPWERFRYWLTRLKVRWQLRRGDFGKVYDACTRCIHPIAPDDAGMVCRECGGKNSRLDV